MKFRKQEISLVLTNRIYKIKYFYIYKNLALVYESNINREYSYKIYLNCDIYKWYHFKSIYSSKNFKNKNKMIKHATLNMIKNIRLEKENEL